MFWRKKKAVMHFCDISEFGLHIHRINEKNKKQWNQHLWESEKLEISVDSSYDYPCIFIAVKTDGKKTTVIRNHSIDCDANFHIKGPWDDDIIKAMEEIRREGTEIAEAERQERAKEREMLRRSYLKEKSDV